MNGKIECPLEQAIKDMGFLQVYDGQLAMAIRQQKMPMPPEERRFFVRHYQQVKNGKFGKWRVKLVYDFRNRKLVTFYINNGDVGKNKDEQKMVSFYNGLTELELSNKKE